MYEQKISKDFVLSFNVKVVTVIRSISLNSINQTIYTQNSLSEYPDRNGVTDKQKYGELRSDINAGRTEKIKTLDDGRDPWIGQESLDS